jgi:hypothetical protein
VNSRRVVVTVGKEEDKKTSQGTGMDLIECPRFVKVVEGVLEDPDPFSRK